MIVKEPRSIVNVFQMFKPDKILESVAGEQINYVPIEAQMFASEWSYVTQEITVLSLYINDNRSGRR